MIVPVWQFEIHRSSVKASWEWQLFRILVSHNHVKCLLGNLQLFQVVLCFLVRIEKSGAQGSETPENTVFHAVKPRWDTSRKQNMCFASVGGVRVFQCQNVEISADFHEVNWHVFARKFLGNRPFHLPSIRRGRYSIQQQLHTWLANAKA